MDDIEINLTHALPRLRPVKLLDNIRIGNDFDGGYVVPRRSLNNLKHLVSFGLGQDCSFELGTKDLVKDLSIDVYDHTVATPSGKSLVINLILSILFRNPGKFRSYRNFAKDYKILFEHATHIKKRVNSHAYRIYDVSILDILEKLTSKEIGLKIDIEGDEFRILDQVLLNSENINFIVIEFHNIEIHFEKFTKLIDSITENFVITHVHANNFGDLNVLGTPDVLEVTFIPNKMVTEVEVVSSLPLAHLDFPNKPNARDFAITWD